MLIGPIIGHRGAPLLAPENTLASFAAAYAQGCRAIECDVVLSRDGQTFIFHDDRLERTSNGRGEIWQLNAAEIRQLDAGTWFSPAFKGEAIPSLQQTLAWLIQHQMQANIEIKYHPEHYLRLSDAVIDEIQAASMPAQPFVLVSSFSPEILQHCRDLSPQLLLGYLLDEWQAEAIALAKALSCYSVHLSRKLVTKERVMLLKDQGFHVFVYTVNQGELMNQYRAMGIDGVFSDYPKWNWETGQCLI